MIAELNSKTISTADFYAPSEALEISSRFPRSYQMQPTRDCEITGSRSSVERRKRNPYWGSLRKPSSSRNGRICSEIRATKSVLLWRVEDILNKRGNRKTDNAVANSGVHFLEQWMECRKHRGNWKHSDWEELEGSF